MTRGKKTPERPRPRGWRRLVAFLLTLAVAGGLVWGIKRLGDSARRGIGPRDRYAVRFGDIACDAPPGSNRRAFLAEVQFASQFPDTFQSIDPELTPKLTAAFATHPWVAKVESMSVEPPDTVCVKLTFRTPVLVVKLTDGGVRVVDGAGVLLPRDAKPDDLPELVTPVRAPTTPSGQVWADDIVKRAVELVEAHHPRKLEKTPTGWRLTMSDGKMLVVEK